jgi:hypothetical protein
MAIEICALICAADVCVTRRTGFGNGLQMLAGGCPAASYFFLRGQEKATKKKATPTSPNLPTTCRFSGLVDGYAERRTCRGCKGEGQNRSGGSVRFNFKFGYALAAQ